MKRISIIILFALSLILFLALSQGRIQPAQAQTMGYSLRFYGHGVDDIDRVKVKIDSPAAPVDVALHFTIEFWLKASLADNPSADCIAGSGNWINGNIIVDRDVFGAGDYGDFGISLANGKIAFGAASRTREQTVCGATSIADDAWHHIAVTRNYANGQMRIFVDGVLDGSGVGPTGNLSYRDRRVTSYPNSDPFLVFGAEKHDAGTEFPSFNGFLDEVRISRNIRYLRAFTSPTAPFKADAYTAALYHFDEGPAGDCTGVIINSSLLARSGGTCQFGGDAPCWARLLHRHSSVHPAHCHTNTHSHPNPHPDTYVNFHAHANRNADSYTDELPPQRSRLSMAAGQVRRSAVVPSTQQTISGTRE